MLGYFDASDGNPKITLEIAGTKGTKVQIPALFDTGHNGSLSLSILQLIQVGAVLADMGEVELANGRKELMYYFLVTVTIDGTEKEVLASMIENPNCDEAIAGLELFAPYVAVIDFEDKTIKFVKKKEVEKELKN